MFRPTKMKYKALGINIYGGGFTLGVMRHFEVVGQWEEINLGKRTFDLNFEGIPRPLNRSDWPIATVGSVDLIYANPPCTPWSFSNNAPGRTIEKRFKDCRLELTKHTMEAALAIRPKVFISESVENAFNIGAPHYDPYIEMWLNAGYAVTFFLNDAVLQGSPSARRRFHFIAHQHDLQLGQPPKLTRAVTVRDAIGDLTKKLGKVSQHERQDRRPYCDPYLKLVPPGGKLYQALVKANYSGPRVSFLLRRLMWDAPACTMVGFEFIHPDGTRWLTYREALRLCSYPDSFITHDATEAVDAVLPCVAEFLAQVAKKTIQKAKPCAIEHKVVDWRPAGKPWHPMERRKAGILT